MSNPMKHTTTPQKADGNSERGGCGVTKPRAFEEENKQLLIGISRGVG